MEIQRLKSEIIANIRSASAINNITQCVTELVLNSLDSKSTSIAVRINLVIFKVQVVDNGEGITKKDLELVGLRYMTSKCNNLIHLERHIKYHGFRGEALASIISISKKVNITSKHINSMETYAKNFGKYTDNQITSVKNRPSYGTTVTIEGFLNTLPIRRNRMVPELELESVKRSIESLIIMYPNVSFSVRNDISGHLIINSKKNKDIISSFKYLHPEIEEEFSLMKVTKDKFSVEALLFKSLFANKYLQYIYVNRRPIHCSRIQKCVTKLFFKNKNLDKAKSFSNKLVDEKNKYPIFVINIKCPHSQVDILLNPSKTLVDFKNWTVILQCLEKLVYSFFGNTCKIGTGNKNLAVRKEFNSGGGVSQIYGAFTSYGYKRKHLEKDVSQKKVKKMCSQNDEVVDESHFTAEDKEFADGIVKKLVNPKSDFVQENAKFDRFISSQKQLNKHTRCRIDEDVSQNHIKEKQLKKLHTDKAENIDKSVSDSDMYDISDTTSIKKIKVKKFKKPLPIKIIQNKSVHLQGLQSLMKKVTKRYPNMNLPQHFEKNKNCSVQEKIPASKNAPIQPALHQIIPRKLDDEKSTLSKFTADENKGKHLIMDMFLKSTQVYSTEEDNQSDARSDETILEVESNFLLENNIQTKVNGLSKTMSVSVNIRSMKKIKKPKLKVNTTKKADRTSKCIQTTLDDNKMVSKCIQTTIDQNFLKSKIYLKHGDRNDFVVGKKPAENYTIVLSDTVRPNESPRFRFVYHNSPRPILDSRNKLTSPVNCKCNCHLNAGKIFNFDNNVYRKCNKLTDDNILNTSIDVLASGTDLNEVDLSSIEKVYDDGEPERYENIKRKPLQVKMNQFVQNYSQQEQHLHNVPYTNDGLVFRTVPNVQKSYLQGCVTTQKKVNENVYSGKMCGVSRSPYFLPVQNTFYPKINLDNRNRICGNKNNKFGLTPYPVKEHSFNMVPNNVGPYELFEPQYRSTQFGDFNTNYDQYLNNYVSKGNNVPLQMENFNEINFTIDHFGNFQPVYKSTQQDLMKSTSFQRATDVHSPFVEHDQNSFNSELNLINVSENMCESLNLFNHSMINFDDDLQSVGKNTRYNLLGKKLLKKELQSEQKTMMSDPFCEFKHQKAFNPQFGLRHVHQPAQENIPPENAKINHSPTGQKRSSEVARLIGHSDEQSKLIITLSNQEKQELLRKELDTERDLNAKTYLEWDSQQAVPKVQEDIQQNGEFGNEWVKSKNNFGSSFYINKRTGFTTFLTPKPNDNQFKFGRRFEFMPKGLSPILRDVQQVDKSLNQNDKDKLQGYILECHQDELLIVKWQNYIKHNDPKTFFDEVYKEKLKLFEDYLPKTNVLDRKKYISELDDITHFNKTLFGSINVIGQVDKKFIAVLDKTKNLLILFDQHAVHERIRLEELLKVYTNAKIKWVEKLVFFIPQNDLSLLKKQELYLSSLGLSVEFFINGINILEIPLCIYNRFKNNDNQDSLSEVIKLLINEIIELLKKTRGVSFGNLPRIIQNIINLEACRGAIKFGDYLNKEECRDLLSKLSFCRLPFQCAHGRPTLTPLIRLNLRQTYVPCKVNFKATLF